MKFKIAIVDTRIGIEAERSLMLRGYRVVALPPFSKLSEAVASHPDMLIRRIGNEYISYADYCEEASYVFSDLSLMLRGEGVRFTFSADEVEPTYPRDVGLNALKIGGKLFCRMSSASELMLRAARSRGIEIVNVKQGYPACTVLKLNEEAVITADRGMAKLLRAHGIRVTLIDAGDVSLPPHEYGFIGGAGEVEADTLYLFGDPMTHRDGEKIVDVARREGLKVVSLSSGVLRDLGGILFAEGDIN